MFCRAEHKTRNDVFPLQISEMIYFIDHVHLIGKSERLKMRMKESQDGFKT